MRRRIRKQIGAAALSLAVLLCAAHPAEAWARTVSTPIVIGGRTVSTSLTATLRSSSATTAYTYGDGRVSVRITGFVYVNGNPAFRGTKYSERMSEQTPRGVTVYLAPDSGDSFYEVWSYHEYSVSGGSGDYTNKIEF